MGGRATTQVAILKLVVGAQALLRSRYRQYQGMELDGLPVIAIRIERVTRWGNLSVD
jgi:hypothetical protein